MKDFKLNVVFGSVLLLMAVGIFFGARAHIAAEAALAGEIDVPGSFVVPEDMTASLDGSYWLNSDQPSQPTDDGDIEIHGVFMGYKKLEWEYYPIATTYANGLNITFEVKLHEDDEDHGPSDIIPSDIIAGFWDTVATAWPETQVLTLGKSGAICEAYGHRWQADDYQMCGCLLIVCEHTFAHHRTCVVCKKRERKMPPVVQEWKDVQ